MNYKLPWNGISPIKKGWSRSWTTQNRERGRWDGGESFACGDEAFLGEDTVKRTYISESKEGKNANSNVVRHLISDILRVHDEKTYANLYIHSSNLIGTHVHLRIHAQYMGSYSYRSKNVVNIYIKHKNRENLRC